MTERSETVGSSPTGTTTEEGHPLWVVFFCACTSWNGAYATLRCERTSTGRRIARCQWQKQRDSALETLSVLPVAEAAG